MSKEFITLFTIKGNKINTNKEWDTVRKRERGREKDRERKEEKDVYVCSEKIYSNYFLLAEL